MFRFLKLGAFAACCLLLSSLLGRHPLVSAQPNLSRNEQLTPPTRRVNVPYTTLPVDAIYGLPAISLTSNFWFGQVSSSQNFVDTRLIYNSSTLFVHVNVYDRYLHFSQSPNRAQLLAWDSAALYLTVNGTNYRFDAQFAPDEWIGKQRQRYQIAYQNGVMQPGISFSTHSHYRGEGGPNSELENRGWWVVYQIPFSSLGLKAAPAVGSAWNLGLQVYDRDQIGVPATLSAVWPEAMQATQPTTWGQLAFGSPTYTPPAVSSPTTYLLQAGVNSQMQDAHVGGHTNCGGAEENPLFGTPQPGKPFPDVYNGWPNNNFGTYEQINIQNQIDVVDWPCYSRYYFSATLDQLPPGKQVVSAKLTLFQFGNGGLGYEYYNSYLQVYTLNQTWSETSITWNNAPLAYENVSGASVDAVRLENYPSYFVNPPLARTIDISRALANYYYAGQPLNVAIWSADAPPHSGKYFYSTNVADARYRPVLEVVLGDVVGGGQAPAVAPTAVVAPAGVVVVQPEQAPSTAVLNPLCLGTVQGKQVTIGTCGNFAKIAKALGISLQSLIAANPQIKNPNLVRVGQVIKLP
jgi:hypothetical protein